MIPITIQIGVIYITQTYEFGILHYRGGIRART